MKFTFLQKEEIHGDTALQVMKDYGTRAGYSDLVMILGGWASEEDFRTREGRPTGCWWSATAQDDGVYTVCSYGDAWALYPNMRGVAARPVLQPSEASLIQTSAERTIWLYNDKEVTVVEYGEYPQTAASDEVSFELEKQHRQNQLNPTGKKYTFDSAGLENYETRFQARKCPEYVFQSKKYIRIEGKPADENSFLSTGEQVRNEAYWVEVRPIKWLKDQSGTLISKDLLFAGIQFDCRKTCFRDFEKTNINRYLQKCFAQEIKPSHLYQSSRLFLQTQSSGR